MRSISLHCLIKSQLMFALENIFETIADGFLWWYIKDDEWMHKQKETIIVMMNVFDLPNLLSGLVSTTGAGGSERVFGQSVRGLSREMACSKVPAQASRLVKWLGRLNNYWLYTLAINSTQDSIHCTFLIVAGMEECSYSEDLVGPLGAWITPPFSTQGEIKSVGTRTPNRSNLKPSVSLPSGLGTEYINVSF